MATIERRNGTYRVKVRRKGARPLTATFTHLAEAKKWAQVTEGAVLEGRHFQASEAKKHILTDLIDAIDVKCFPTRDLQRYPTRYDNCTGGKRILDIAYLPISHQL